MNWKGCGWKRSWPNLSIIPVFLWMDSRKSRNGSVRIAVCVYIRTEDPRIRVYSYYRMFGNNKQSSIILVPATEHGYIVASWWRTPLRHPPKSYWILFLTNFPYSCASGKKEKAVLYPVEVPPHRRQLSRCHNGKETQRVQFTRH
jgi:hypothetical protein